MIYTPMTKKALKLCFSAHRDQVDKGGMPYVFHPFHLAEQMTGEAAVIVALLHDVVEDTDVTLADLSEMGFSQSVIAAIQAMTHPSGMSYMDYIAEIRKNPLARQVKLADLRHNSDLSRLNHTDPQALARIEKYRAAIAFLEEA